MVFPFSCWPLIAALLLGSCLQGCAQRHRATVEGLNSKRAHQEDDRARVSIESSVATGSMSSGLPGEGTVPCGVLSHDSPVSPSPIQPQTNIFSSVVRGTVLSSSSGLPLSMSDSLEPEIDPGKARGHLESLSESEGMARQLVAQLKTYMAQSHFDEAHQYLDTLCAMCSHHLESLSESEGIATQIFARLKTYVAQSHFDEVHQHLDALCAMYSHFDPCYMSSFFVSLSEKRRRCFRYR